MEELERVSSAILKCFLRLLTYAASGVGVMHYLRIDPVGSQCIRVYILSASGFTFLVQEDCTRKNVPERNWSQSAVLYKLN